jgi:hypothetical protein
MAKVKISGGGNWKKAMKAYIGDGEQSVSVGILGGATYSADSKSPGLPVAVVAAAHEFGTTNIPARSFIRSTLANKKEEWLRFFSVMLEINKRNVRAALAGLGEIAAKDMLLAIENGLKPALKPATVRAKLKRKGKEGSPELPLVDTGTLEKALGYQVAGDEIVHIKE